MKAAVLVLIVIFAAQTFAQSNDILECFAPALEGSNANREDLREWSDDLRATTIRLQSQRQRCVDLPRDDPPSAMQDRMIQACNAAFTASLAYELNRLYTELHSIDPELAAQLREKSAHCFSQAPTREYFINVLNNIL